MTIPYVRSRYISPQLQGAFVTKDGQRYAVPGPIEVLSNPRARWWLELTPEDWSRLADGEDFLGSDPTTLYVLERLFPEGLTEEVSHGIKLFLRSSPSTLYLSIVPFLTPDMYHYLCAALEGGSITHTYRGPLAEREELIAMLDTARRCSPDELDTHLKRCIELARHMNSTVTVTLNSKETDDDYYSSSTTAHA